MISAYFMNVSLILTDHILINKVHIHNIHIHNMNIVCHAAYIAFIHPFCPHFLSYNNCFYSLHKFTV